MGANAVKFMDLSWATTPSYQMATVVGSLLVACYRFHDKHKLLIHIFLHHLLFHQNIFRLYLNNQTTVVITYVVGASHVVLQFVCVVTINTMICWFMYTSSSLFWGTQFDQQPQVQFTTSPYNYAPQNKLKTTMT